MHKLHKCVTYRPLKWEVYWSQYPVIVFSNVIDFNPVSISV